MPKDVRSVRGDYQAKNTKATSAWRRIEGCCYILRLSGGALLHIRTTNPIENVFATVRLRHDKTKGNGSRAACLAMVYKLMESASKSWRSLNGSLLLAEVIKGTVFIDGIKEKPAA